jgi:phosphatidylglycerol---prolipoprotein diacylglyceryl transferase
MYPNLYYAFKDLFGVEWKALRFVNSFGFFVALAFILAAIVLAAELKRKAKQGFLQPTEIDIEVGKPASIIDLVLNFVLGFVLGYKILALFILDSSATADPQKFIFSPNGSWPAGIALGLFFAGLKWYEKNKQKLPKPENRKVRFWPHDRVGEIIIIGLVFGLLGAKLFDIFESVSRKDFWENPGAYILSPEGLTFYGGLICAALAIWWYAKKHKISFWHLNDAAAPALMIAYALGRVGCQVSGDGDWGIFNSAYALDPDGSIVSAHAETFRAALNTHTNYFVNNFGGIDSVPHAFFNKPGFLSFLPNWLFGYNYPNNVNSAGVTIAGCIDTKYCNQLPAPVFPTPFYETITCTLLFGVLWFFRKRLKVPGTLFALYLILNGMERFFVEKIRVNSKMNFLGMGIHITQAELISSCLFISGVVLWFYLRRKTPQTVESREL